MYHTYLYHYSPEGFGNSRQWWCANDQIDIRGISSVSHGYSPATRVADVFIMHTDSQQLSVHICMQASSPCVMMTSEYSMKVNGTPGLCDDSTCFAY